MRAPDDVVAIWTPAGETAPVVFQRVKGPMMAACWPMLRGFIEAACARSRGRFTPQWVAQRLSDRTDHLWAAVAADGTPRGALTTHLGDYPTGLRVLEVILAGGERIGRTGAAAVLAALEAYQREQACARIEWQGRAGLPRFLGLGERGRVIATMCEVG